MTVLFNAPIFVFAAATVCTFVYYYTKEKACNDFTATTSSSSNNHANDNAEADEQ